MKCKLATKTAVSQARQDTAGFIKKDFLEKLS